ncbi:similar to Saccharomyces cerevisiae YBR168W PEX32 Peroxisomal integral membrane protein, involved in negative regulation of peroxisome size [Maudiozyma barnettii]|uniref:Similar to Saccharomyces cerevisiae YBR168W PEX32 Peroxisomal integral membrane protein, involved in negative regulation of peroxisome size n=1 Tax=Maudiozyma barnettii TaxID=61262 RepID=A0A8H2ZGH8_9SACH|nr:Pex32p [Kazachstania barnettii]CAB4253658.1 similar to Saccharomyces cerevisiae YBR168W PEX32 Peroxisomal integral membrane protein, involved in negative regulation of peroxisome size [Kazachstania barnettii]CAD1781350.1 similar to Saccharomyces cerevisiae YBR168W PEX32 Peroxisomal integral membrane protein, involved in negative regulation of peroxisome size [Kazachstania barnettii]
MESPHYAQFVTQINQRIPLIMTTPLPVLKGLSDLYPLLIIIDNILSTLLWTTDDSPLIFVNMMMVCLSIRYLFIPNNLIITETCVQHMLLDYLGLLCTSFLMCSTGYYLHTVIMETRNSEPPTVDDIVILLENVEHKLHVIKKEALNLFVINNYRVLFQWLTLATFIQVLIFKFHLLPYINDTKSYLIVAFITVSIFHTRTIQGLLQILWRLQYLRIVYFWWRGPHDKFYSIKNLAPLAYFNMIISNQSYITVKLTIQNTEELIKIETLRNRLIELYEQEENIPQMTEISTPSLTFNIMKICVKENQRKWQNGAWTEKTLSYERSNFTIVSPFGTVFNSDNPLNYETNVPPNWIKLDEMWNKSPWTYGDGNWQVIGSKDSTECFTRTRSWSFRIFQRKPK